MVVSIETGMPGNRFSLNLMEELANVLESIQENEENKVIILSGENGNFSTGIDIKEMNGISVSDAFRIAATIKKIQNLIINSPKIFIASINGYCLGAGLEIALVCDFRFASYNAIFGLPQVNLGIIPGGGGITRLIDTSGRTLAAKLILIGESIKADEAMNYGLITDMTEDPMQQAFQLADALKEKSALALSMAKKYVNYRLLENQAQIDLENQAFSLMFDFPDSVEGMSAFIEKRKPVFISKPRKEET